MENRKASPGAIKMPQGAKDKEKIADLERRLAALEERVTTAIGKKGKG